MEWYILLIIFGIPSIFYSILAHYIRRKIRLVNYRYLPDLRAGLNQDLWGHVKRVEYQELEIFQ